MNTSPKISIIVPIYNVGQFIAQCIESLINQTYKNLEIILVNDGSTDYSSELCNYYAEKDNRITVIHKSNEGLVSARKSGLKISTGEYIACVDGDDWVEPEMYGSLLKIAMQTNVDIVVAGHKEELNGEIIEIGKNFLPAGFYDSKGLTHEIHKKMLYTGTFSEFGIYSYLWNKLFKREAFYKYQMSVSNEIFIGEDAACVYPAILNANNIYITEESHYIYRQHIKSMVKTNNQEILSINKFNLVYRHLYNEFSKSNLKYNLINQLNNFMLSLLTVRSSLKFLYNQVYKIDCLQSNIIVYSAGTFGQHVHKMLSDHKLDKSIKWIDSKCNLYRHTGLPVGEIEFIKNNNFDYILVAYINEKFAENANQTLIDIGVDASKIKTPQLHKEKNIAVLLSQLGIEMENNS